MGDAFWIVLTTVAIFVIVAPVTLVALFARQIFPYRPYTTMSLIALGIAVFPLLPFAWGAALWLQLEGRRQRRRQLLTLRPAAPAMLGREWHRATRAAHAAAQRYDGAVAAMPSGPLRDRLLALRDEVRSCIGEAERLAGEGSRLDVACRDVERALSRRRRAARGQAVPNLESSLAAQQSSLSRLQAQRTHVRVRLHALIARLDQIAACAAEIGLCQPDHADAPAALTEQVEALRLAIDDVERLAAVGATR